MDQFRIISLKGRLVLDSRGIPTVEAEVELSGGIVERAIVPSGASTGSFEAHELRDGDKTRYKGKGVLKAVGAIDNEIAPMLAGQDVRRAPFFDEMMIELDGTPQKNRLGANAILAVSIACARAASAADGMPLYRHLGGPYARSLPVPLINVINGGVHADNGLDFQEFMIVPVGAPRFSEALRMSSEFFMSLKANLKQRGLATNVGDEGGFAPDLKSSQEALDILVETGADAGLPVDGTCFSIALDVAASEFFHDGHYVIESGKRKLNNDEMITELASLCKNYAIMSIEDGLHEEDWTGWQALTASIGDRVQLVGDDLFVTNPKRLRKGLKLCCGNAILVKINQIGTLSEAVEAVMTAHKAGYNAVMSHRSGESEDTTIADLAVGLGCSQIKTGSLSRSERVAKYNRLLRIEEELGSQALYSGNNLKIR